MKRCAAVFLILYTSTIATAQIVAIQNDKRNTLTVGIVNPVQVAVEGYKAEELIVTMDSAFVTGGKGIFDLLPRVPSEDLVMHVGIKTSNGIKEVDVMHVRTECLLVKDAFLLGKREGNMSITGFRAAIAIQAPIMCYEFSAYVKVTGFTIVVTRDDKIIFNKRVSDPQGARIDMDVEIDSMKSGLMSGDKVKFLNITYLGPDGPRCAGTLNSMEFTMVD